MFNKNKYLKCFTGAALLLAAAPQAIAQDAAANYPSRTIRYIVGYTPGGTSDMLARAVGQKLAAAWGQQVIVDNRPGAGTNIGTELGAKAPADSFQPRRKPFTKRARAQNAARPVTTWTTGSVACRSLYVAPRSSGPSCVSRSHVDSCMCTA